LGITVSGSVFERNVPRSRFVPRRVSGRISKPMEGNQSSGGRKTKEKPKKNKPGRAARVAAKDRKP